METEDEKQGEDRQQNETNGEKQDDAETVDGELPLIDTIPSNLMMNKR